MNNNSILFDKPLPYLYDMKLTWVISGDREDGLVIIVEDNTLIDELSDSFKQYNKQIIITTGKVGLQNLFYGVQKEIYFLQMRRYTLVHKYLFQFKFLTKM